jgi:hypothetical protein
MRWLRLVPTGLVALTLAVAARGDNGMAIRLQPTPLPPNGVPGPTIMEPMPMPPSGEWEGSGIGSAADYNTRFPAPSSRVHDRMRRCYLNCWSHHNETDCGSLKSELHFLFGSCRTFFGERCSPRPDDVDHFGWRYRSGGYWR